MRPERINVRGEAPGLLPATVREHVYLGTDIQIRATLVDGEPILVRVQNAAIDTIPAPGSTVWLDIEAGAARLLTD